MGKSQLAALAAGIMSLSSILTVGCLADPDEPTEQAESNVSQAIVKGIPSVASQDAAVLLLLDGALCSGTLIAPNLVLTARHCVAGSKSKDECTSFKKNVAPSTIGVVLGVNATTASPDIARGTKIFDDGDEKLCSHDIALVVLDKEIVGARTATVRLTPATAADKGTAVGYGQDGEGRLTKGRFQRPSVKVDGVGPSKYKFKDSGKNYEYALRSGEFVTGESTCFGDSGGPLFDKEGRVFGVTSRGFGNCRNLPSIWTDVAAHASLIKNAAVAAGHPLDSSDGGIDAGAVEGGAAGGGTPSTGSGTSDSGVQSTGEGAQKGDGGTSSQSTPTASAEEEASDSPPASSCSVTATGAPGSGTGSGLELAAIAATVAIAVRLRRRAQKPTTST